MLQSSKYKSLVDRVLESSQKLKRQVPRIIVVSKTRTAEEIKAVYDTGCRDFGENYVEEMVEKSQQLPQDIRWHFIGHLQSNKIKKALIPNLFMLHSVDRASLADKINKELAKNNVALSTLVQIRTSAEKTKNGCQIADSLTLIKHIIKQCPLLKFKVDQRRFKGLMTIGEQGDQTAFDEMTSLRDKVSEQFGIPKETLELSMGMSGDYEKAIQKGSTSVRVGTLVFGPRVYKAKPAE